MTSGSGKNKNNLGRYVTFIRQGKKGKS
jgi:hypothetical protein